MEGDGRVCVMLRMVGHVPREETDEGVGVDGARVREHVRDHRAASVLGEEVEPEHGLAEHDGTTQTHSTAALPAAAETAATAT